MPLRARHPCTAPGCTSLVTSGRWCEAHRPPQHDTRPTAHQRGYGARWQKLRAAYLHQHPLCADPFQLHGARRVLATDVDHITPKRDGGRDVDENLQALCHSCHSRKTFTGS